VVHAADEAVMPVDDFTDDHDFGSDRASTKLLARLVLWLQMLLAGFVRRRGARWRQPGRKRSEPEESNP
jgi:hypothetical protein